MLEVLRRVGRTDCVQQVVYLVSLSARFQVLFSCSQTRRKAWINAAALLLIDRRAARRSKYLEVLVWSGLVASAS